MICCSSAVNKCPFKGTYYSILGKECLLFGNITCCPFRMYCLAPFTVPQGPSIDRVYFCRQTWQTGSWFGGKEIKYIWFGQDTTQPLLPTGSHDIHIYFHWLVWVILYFPKLNLSFQLSDVDKGDTIALAYTFNITRRLSYWHTITIIYVDKVSYIT